MCTKYTPVAKSFEAMPTLLMLSDRPMERRKCVVKPPVLVLAELPKLGAGRCSYRVVEPTADALASARHIAAK
jgi:hypothetical protein